MSIHLGSTETTKIYSGSTEVTSAYLGSTLVYAPDGYDIFLIAGQSNTYRGAPYTADTHPDASLDAEDADIKQWGRFSPNDGVVIAASEPLDHNHLTPPINSSWIGWAMTFAKMYKANGYLKGNRKILLVPAGQGGSSFAANHWNEDDSLYNDAVNRTNAALATGSGVNRLKGILWHQGESDSDNQTEADAHNAALLAMIDAMRTDFGDSTLPFIAGGMVPQWVEDTTPRQTVQANLVALPSNRSYTGYANPDSPTELLPADNEASDPGANHFGGRDMRGYTGRDLTDASTCGLAGRYWTAYLSALTNS